MEITKDTDQNKQLSLEYQDKCDSNFNCENTTLNLHSKKHMEKLTEKAQVNFNTFKCELCEKSFKLNIGLNRHVRKCKLRIIALNKLKCSICNIFIDKANYNEHVKTHENNSTEKKIDFTLNLKLCKLNGVWKSKQNVVYTCNICFQKFHAESDLVDHKELHEQNELQMQCGDCLMFIIDSEFADHMQRMHSKYAFKCLECDLSFDKKQNLDCHLLYCTKSSRNIWKKFQTVVKREIDSEIDNEAQKTDCFINLSKSKVICTNFKNNNSMDQINAENSNESIVETAPCNVMDNECSQKLNKEKNKYIKVAEKIDSTNSNESIVETVPHNLTVYNCGMSIKKEKGLCSNVVESDDSNQVNETDINSFTVEEPISNNLMMYDYGINIKKEKDLCTSVTEIINSDEMDATNDNKLTVETSPHNLMVNNCGIIIKKEKGLHTNNTENISSDQINTTDSNEYIIETEPHNLMINIKKEKDLCTNLIECNNSDQVNSTNNDEFTNDIMPYNLQINDHVVNIKREKGLCTNLTNSNNSYQINTLNNDVLNIETASTNFMTNNHNQNINTRKILHTNKPTNSASENIVCVESIYFSIRKLRNIENTSSIVNYEQTMQNNVKFICNICNKSPSTDIHSFALHMSDHRECNLHECIVCDKKFESVNLWTNHMSYHQEQIDLIFSKSQNSSKIIESNIFTDTNLGSTEPQLPFMTLRNRENRRSSKTYFEIEDYYTDPVLDINNSTKKSKNHCNICNMIFPSKLTLIAHHKTLHNNQLQSYSSNYCDKNNSSETSSTNHENLHRQSYTANTFSSLNTTNNIYESFKTQRNTNIAITNGNSILINPVEINKQIVFPNMPKQFSKPTNLNNDHINGEEYVNKSKKTKRTVKEHCKNLSVSIGKKMNNFVDKTKEKKKSICSICKKQFGHRGALSNHMRSHINTQHKCRYCSKEFNLKKEYILHEKSHKYIKKIKSVNNLNFNEINIEVNEDKQQKENCNNSLFVNSKFNVTSTDTNLNNFVYNKSSFCSICKIQFEHNDAFSNHMITHSDLQLKCQYCDKIFYFKKALISHEKSHNNNNNKKKIKNAKNITFNEINNECNEDEHQIENYRNSLFINKTIKHKSLICNVCKKQFAHRGALSNHMRSHTNLQNKCRYCEKVFNLKRACLSHENSHRYNKNIKNVNNINLNDINIEDNNDKQLRENCDYSLFVKDEYNDSLINKNLMNDLVNETINDKSLFCSICKKKFAHQGALSNHMRSHTNPQNKCRYCEKVFNLKRVRISHEKCHRFNKKIKNVNLVNLNEIQYKDNEDMRQKENCNYSLLPGKLNDGTINKNLVNETINDKSFICSICKKQFNRHISLSNHMRSHNNQRHKCKYCNKAFITKKSFISHEKIHKLGQKIKNINNINFNEVDVEIIEHKQQRGNYDNSDNIEFINGQNRTHLAKKDHIWFACDVCEKKFSTPFPLIIHRNLHSDITPCVCKICNKSYIIKYEWNRHLKNHYIRSKILNSKNNNKILNHSKLQTSKLKINSTQLQSPFKCGYCKKEYHLINDWKKHLSLSKECCRHYNNTCPVSLQVKETQRYECNICKKTYSSLYNRKVHIQAIHKKLTNTNKDIGNKQLTTIENIQQMPNISNQRQRQISKDTNYSCNLCGKYYSNSANLSRHQTIIHGMNNKPIKCQVCKRIFKHKYTYQTHFLTKHKKFLNNGKITVNKNNLMNLRYKCLICKTKFADNIALQKHLLIHTTNQYPCKDCGQQFETNVTLGEHILKNHNTN